MRDLTPEEKAAAEKLANIMFSHKEAKASIAIAFNALDDTELQKECGITDDMDISAVAGEALGIYTDEKAGSLDRLIVCDFS